MKLILGALLFACFSVAVSLPLSKSKVLLIEPKTIKYHASFYKSTLTFTDSERIMHFPTGGSNNEELIRVPLAGAGELDPQAVIKITVALKPVTVVQEGDPHVGLSDGVTENLFRIDDTNGLCYLSPGSSTNPSTNPTITQHYEYTLLFEPFRSYGACSHIGGHITPGYFSRQVDLRKGLDLVVKRENTDELYDFYYFLVEVL